jgi:hypothetical protein
MTPPSRDGLVAGDVSCNDRVLAHIQLPVADSWVIPCCRGDCASCILVLRVMLFKETLLRLRSSETVIDADLFMHFVGLQVIHVAATTAYHEPVSLVAQQGSPKVI